MRKAIGLILLAWFVISACSLAATATPDVGAIQTAAVQTALAAIPTATATAAATPTFAPDPYIVELVNRVDAYDRRTTQVRDQLKRLSDDPSLMVDSEWKARMTMQLDALSSASQDLANVPGVTPKFRKLDQEVDALAQETIEMTVDLAAGINANDVDSINKAAGHVDNMVQMKTQVEGEIDYYLGR